MNTPEFYLTMIHVPILGYALRRLREARRLTLRELADKTREIDIDNSVDPSFISLIEGGKRLVSYPVLNGLAQALGIDPWWLLTLAMPLHPSIPKVKKGPPTGVSQKADNLGRQLQEVIAKELFGSDLNTFINDFMKIQ